jgi:hypothetical protein
MRHCCPSQLLSLPMELAETQFYAVWPLFRCLLLLGLHLLGFALNLLLFESCSINYRFIFTFDPR